MGSACVKVVRVDAANQGRGVPEAVEILSKAAEDQSYNPIAISDAFKAFEKNKSKVKNQHL